ncbi:phosphate sensor histidine kinase, HAMP and PAS domain-containing [Geotalea daltonii FRC-32]|uniref:histidine kinase n=1 Tax=Geotalea daltonii (strain DSM 22248 / JCM 15807 / FRC-32) TaxID=316067 RepID=B9M6A7_GEODF|nr:ATP-binding protein [Geotalea daltonii]ACM21895.1 phosphate sensor histidine kinase, HAMP and PAS domain-containing [Geotalea daltonii FRC-32]
MRASFRLKLMLSYLCLVLLMGAIIYAYLNNALERYVLAEIRNNLISETKLAALIADKSGENLHRDAPAIAAAVGKEIKARVTIISSDGQVVGDSELSPVQLKDLENHLYRPEVQASLKDGTGTAIRYSSTLQMPMLYVARPLALKNGETATLRLALPLAQLQKARSHMHLMLGIALFLAVLAVLFFSYVMSNITSRSLRTISAIAARIGKGEYGLRVPRESSDEVGELAVVMNDMSERIEAQLSSIMAERNRLDTILRGMGEGLMVTDAQGIITLVNPAFRKVFSVDEDVEGRPLIEVSRQPALHAAYRKIMADGIERQEEMSLNGEKDGNILTHWVPLIDGNRLTGVVAVFHDISDLKRLAATRRDFVANVSHELRTPVSVIQGYAETLLAGALESDPDRARRFIQVIHNHAERLSALIADLLTLSELESGKVLLEPHPLNLRSAVKQAMSLLSQRATDKGITLDTGNIEASRFVLADKGKLDQVLVNLLDNAIKYTPGNGKVTVTAEDEAEMLKISVTDTGLGIPAKDLPRIFERFYRVDEARSRDKGGTGLGLSIVKHIVQSHGGMISVKSIPGEGSTFSFTLKKGGK